MKNHEPELIKALKKFEKLLKEHVKDDYNDVLVFKSFLRNFLRIKPNSVDLPISQVMTVLKHERPTIFYLIKRNFSDDLIFDFLTNIDTGDYTTARNRIIELLNSTITRL